MDWKFFMLQDIRLLIENFQLVELENFLFTAFIRTGRAGR
ncbi:hypothetical protein SAMN05660368_02223 [Marvinbryantia formatexigens]|nr:hypothetical protein SAMN05660368_02223 [Marvinbryantia formatexigens]